MSGDYMEIMMMVLEMMMLIYGDGDDDQRIGSSEVHNYHQTESDSVQTSKTSPKG